MNRVIKDGQTFEYFRTKKLALMYCKAHGRPYKDVLGADNKKAKIGERWHVEIPVSEKKLNLFARFKARLDKLFS